MLISIWNFSYLLTTSPTSWAFFSNLWLHFDNTSCEIWRPATGHLAPGAKRSGHGHHSSSSCHWRGRWVWFTSSAQISPHLGLEMAIPQSDVCFSKWWVAAVLVSGRTPSEQLLEAEEQRPERHQHLQAFQLIYIHNARFLSKAAFTVRESSWSQLKKYHFLRSQSNRKTQPMCGRSVRVMDNKSLSTNICNQQHQQSFFSPL